MELIEIAAEFINSVGFPIFACLYLVKTNEKILMTIDNRLEVIDLRLEKLEGAA